MPAAVVDALRRHPPRRRPPAHVAGDRRERRAGGGVERAAQQRALVEAAAEPADDEDRPPAGPRPRAARRDRVDGDRRAVQAARLRAHRRCARGRRSGRAARRRRGSVSSGIRWLPAAVCTTTVARSKRLLEDAAGGVDVLDAQHRHQRAPDRQRAVADVDRVRADVPAPVAPAQLRHEHRADRPGRRAGSSGASSASAPSSCRADHDSGDRDGAPRTAAARTRHTQRAVGDSARVRLGAHSLRREVGGELLVLRAARPRTRTGTGA